MDLNYILGREQISLHNASIATSSPARLSHEGLAAGYGALLAASTFPHRYASDATGSPAKEADVHSREKEGGARHHEEASAATPGLLGGSEGATEEATRGYIVQTPNGEKPYKVVLEHEGGADTEYPASSMREGERFIRAWTPVPPVRDKSWDRPS
jgi:hypothetical protein